MKALTLWQPWAALIAIGAKGIETRSWGTNYRGPLAIHAARNVPIEGRMALLMSDFAAALVEAGVWDRRLLNRRPDPSLWSGPLSRGCIVAVAQLVDCVRMTPRGIPYPVTYRERAFGNFADGRYAWILRDVTRLPQSVPVKGAQGLWEIDLNLTDLQAGESSVQRGRP